MDADLAAPALEMSLLARQTALRLERDDPGVATWGRRRRMFAFHPCAQQ